MLLDHSIEHFGRGVASVTAVEHGWPPFPVGIGRTNQFARRRQQQLVAGAEDETNFSR
jgi:hypothetical protein